MLYSANMKRIIDFLDSLDFSPIAMIAILVILTSIRLFLESFSSPESTGLFSSPVGLMCYFSLYGMLIMLFTLRLGALATKPMTWALRVMVLIFPVVMITPLIDLALSKGVGFCIGYVQSGGKSLGWLFTHFLLPHQQMCGMTPGLRIQVIGGMLIVGIIIFATSKSWWRAIIGGAMSYIISFIGGAFPIIINILTRTSANPTFEASTVNSLIATAHYPTSTLPFIPDLVTMTSFLLARVQLIGLIIGAGIIWFYASRHTWRGWWLGSLKKIAVIGMPMIMLLFGAVVGLGGIPESYHLIWPDWTAMILLFLALFFASWNVGAINDIEDVSIDRISNPDRPMIRYGLTVVEMKTIQHISLFFALCCAFLVNYNVLFCIVIFIGAYTFHSSKLLHMKRFWLTSSFCIVLAGCSAFLAGMFALSPEQTVGHFPLAILGMIALILFPYSIIKDVPDIAGDKTQSLSTFPILYGKKVAIGVSLGAVVLWFVLFSAVIPWFFAIGIIITLATLLIKPKLVYEKVWLFGLPTTLVFIGIMLHLIFVV